MSFFDFEIYDDHPSLGSTLASEVQILGDLLTRGSSGLRVAWEEDRANVVLACRAVNGTTVLRFHTVIASRYVPTTDSRVGIFAVNQSDVLQDPKSSWMDFELSSSDAWNARHYVVRHGGDHLEFVCSYLEIAEGVEMEPDAAIARLSSRD